MNPNLIRNYHECLLKVAKLNFLGDKFLVEKENLLIELANSIPVEQEQLDFSAVSLGEIIDERIMFENMVSNKTYIKEYTDRYFLHLYYYLGEVYARQNKRHWNVILLDNNYYCPLLFDKKKQVDSKFLFLVIRTLDDLERHNFTLFYDGFKSMQKETKKIEYWNQYFIGIES